MRNFLGVIRRIDRWFYIDISGLVVILQVGVLACSRWQNSRKSVSERENQDEIDGKICQLSFSSIGFSETAESLDSFQPNAPRASPSSSLESNSSDGYKIWKMTHSHLPVELLELAGCLLTGRLEATSEEHDASDLVVEYDAGSERPADMVSDVEEEEEEYEDEEESMSDCTADYEYRLSDIAEEDEDFEDKENTDYLQIVEKLEPSAAFVPRDVLGAALGFIENSDEHDGNNNEPDA